MSSTIELARLAVSGLSAKDRNAQMKELQPDPQQEKRLARRREVARLLSVSLRTVDHYAKQGLIERVRMPGHKRTLGFRLSDVHALMRAK